MSTEQTTVKEFRADPSVVQALRAMREREAAMSKLLMAFIVAGLVFMLFPGTLLGVWNLLQISGRAERVDLSFLAAGARPRAGVRLGRQFSSGDRLLFHPQAAGARHPRDSRRMGQLGAVDAGRRSAMGGNGLPLGVAGSRAGRRDDGILGVLYLLRGCLTT